MKIKKIVSEQDRNDFKKNMDLSRAERKGGGFRETEKSRLGAMHLKFCELWALYDDEDKMIAGAALHDLATLPASYFKPDFSDYPLDKVIEGSELWSLSSNAALMFQKGMMILLQKREIVCFYCYVPMTPVDLRPFYAGFEPLGEPFIWPWVVTNEGEYTWCQPLGVRGYTMEKIIETVKGDYKFDGLVLELEAKAAPTQARLELDSIKLDIRTIIANKLKIASTGLSDTENLADRGIDSLAAIDVMAEIEKKYSIELPLEFFYENVTINDAAKNIASKLHPG